MTDGGWWKVLANANGIGYVRPRQADARKRLDEVETTGAVQLSRGGERMTRNSLRIAVAVVALLGGVMPAAAQAPAKKPNILFIMGDDIGWYNTSIYNRGDMGYPDTQHRPHRQKKVGCFSVGMGSKAVPLGARPSSPASRRSAPD